MLKKFKKEILIKIIIIPLIFIFITSCSNNGNNTFNILEEAKDFLYGELGLDEIRKEEVLANQEVKITKLEINEDKGQKERNNLAAKKEISNENKNSIEESERTKEEMMEEKILIENETKIIKKNDTEMIHSRLLKIEKSDEKIYDKKKPRINDEDIIVDENFLHEKKLFEDRRKIKIGVLLPLTGDKKNVGRLILNALEIGIFQNKKADIELIIKDTKADPLITIEVFNELLELNVKNFIGPLFASSLLAIDDTIKNNKVNVFALTNNTNMAGENVWVFGIDPQQQAKKIAQFALDEGYKEIALLLPNNQYGSLILETINETLARSNLKTKRVEFFDNNIDSQVVSVKDISLGFDKYNEMLKTSEEKKEDEKSLSLKEIEKPFDCIFIAASGQNLTILASQLQYNGVDPKIIPFLGMASWEKESILREPALEGGYFSTTSDGFQKSVKNIYKTYFNEEMTKISMLAYDILALLTVNIQDYKQIDSDNLINEEGFIGLRGLFRLKKSGVVERTFQIKKIKNKKFITYRKAPKNFYLLN